VFMTVMGTCRANGVNPFDYMMAVARNSDAVTSNPEGWLPWNYRKALEVGEAPKTDPPGSAPPPTAKTGSTSHRTRFCAESASKPIPHLCRRDTLLQIMGIEAIYPKARTSEAGAQHRI